MPLESIQGFKCKRCGHEWRPRKLDKKPVQCPNCANPFWERERLR